MLFPKFLDFDHKIGVVALSRGVGHKLESFNESISYIESYGYHVLETQSVRNDNEPSNNASVRVNELNELVLDDSVDCIWCASGGDFQFETVELLDLDLIKKHPKWLIGASDPTNLLFPVTCACDIATIYGFNAGSFDKFEINSYVENLFKFLAGDFVKLHSSVLHQELDYYNDGRPILNTVTEYVGECDITGRLLGGCFESILDMAGTPIDHVHDFLSRYDDVIWFFDVFSMNSADVYRGLLKMKYMGYFNTCAGVLVGRVLFKNESELISYEAAFKKVFGDIPVILETDVGHTYPHIFVINGAMAHIVVKDGRALIEYKKK